jgi:superfamily II DNA or RNA helicase
MTSNDFLSRILKCDPTYYMAKKNYIPYVHQQLLLWKWRLRREVKVLVGDEIGLGKTIEAALLLRALIVDRDVKRILVLVPKILRDQWYRELSNFFGSYHVKVIDSGDDMGLLLESRDFVIFIISIDLAKREVYRRYFENRWDVLVVDEAHYLGGDSLRDSFVRSLNAVHRIYLSATPHRGKADKYLSLVGHLGNVRSIQDTKKFVERRTKRLVNKLRAELHKGGDVKPVFSNCKVVAIVARATDEEKQFSEDITSFLEYIIKSRNMNEPVLLLTTLIRKRVSSSPHAAVETLKRMLGRFSGAEKIDQKLLKSLASGAVEDLSEALEGFKASEVDEIYEKVTEAFAAGLSDGERERLGGLLDLAERIKEDDSKLKILKAILRLHTSRGEKVIVFTEYKDTLDYLNENLGEFNPVTIYGGLGEREIKGRIEEFRDRGTVLLATDVASEGLNLQIANIVVNYEPPWTPVKLEQRMGRVWRLGQDKDVIVYNLFLGTRADIDVVEKLYKKVLNVAEALEDVKNVLGESVESVEMFLSRTIEEELPLIDVTENKLISAQLQRTFDKEIGEIEERIREVRANLSSAYPVENEKNLKSLIDRLGLPSELEIAKVLRGSFRQALERIEGKVALIFSNEPGYCYGGIARVDLGGFSVELPLYIEEAYEGDVLKVRSGKIGLGAFLELCRVAERAIIPDEAYVSKGSEMLEARRLEPSSVGVRGLVRDLLKSINPEVGVMSVTFEKFFTIVKLPQEALATSRKYSKETGQMGEDLVKRLEEFRGVSVVERKTLGSYDFYTYDPSESSQPEGKRESERYIEVKTHGRGGEWLRLEEGEAEFARNCGQKYWLYTVWMLYGPGEPLILCFRDPLNNPNFRVIEREEEMIVRKKTLCLGFNVPNLSMR